MKRLLSFVAAVAVTFTLHAKLVTRAVGYEEAGTKLEGFLAYDDAVKTARPGVLVVP